MNKDTLMKKEDIKVVFVDTGYFCLNIFQLQATGEFLQAELKLFSKIKNRIQCG